MSHQAPYKHFASRDHILAAVATRSFDHFAAALEAARTAAPPDPAARLEALGVAYFAYARQHPLQYRLMFGTPLPEGQAHPGMMASARHAFDLLRQAIAGLAVQPAGPPSVPLDALFVWAAIHGLSTILQSQVLDTLGLTSDEQAAATRRMLDRIGLALGVDAPDQA